MQIHILSVAYISAGYVSIVDAYHKLQVYLENSSIFRNGAKREYPKVIRHVYGKGQTSENSSGDRIKNN